MDTVNSDYLSIYSIYPLESLICGGLAGMSVDLGLFPLDTIKTRLQVHLYCYC